MWTWALLFPKAWGGAGADVGRAEPEARMSCAYVAVRAPRSEVAEKHEAGPQPRGAFRRTASLVHVREARCPADLTAASVSSH